MMAQGDKFFWATFFDGSDGNGALGVNAIVTDRRDPDAAAGKLWPLLAGSRFSNVQMAFFKSSDETALPESEQQLLMFDNGSHRRTDLRLRGFQRRRQAERAEAAQALLLINPRRRPGRAARPCASRGPCGSRRFPVYP